MTNLERMRREAELMQVKAARMQLEVKVMEKEEEIGRLKEHIKIQEQKEQDITLELQK